VGRRETKGLKMKLRWWMKKKETPKEILATPIVTRDEGELRIYLGIEEIDRLLEGKVVQLGKKKIIMCDYGYENLIIKCLKLIERRNSG